MIKIWYDTTIDKIEIFTQLNSSIGCNNLKNLNEREFIMNFFLQWIQERARQNVETIFDIFRSPLLFKRAVIMFAAW